MQVTTCHDQPHSYKPRMPRSSRTCHSSTTVAVSRERRTCQATRRAGSCEGCLNTMRAVLRSKAPFVPGGTVALHKHSRNARRCRPVLHTPRASIPRGAPPVLGCSRAHHSLSPSPSTRRARSALAPLSSPRTLLLLLALLAQSTGQSTPPVIPYCFLPACTKTPHSPRPANPHRLVLGAMLTARATPWHGPQP